MLAVTSRTLLTSVCLLLCISLQTCAPELPIRPNIILILVDDLGWNDPGFMGNTFHETPALDRLAEEGMIFTQAYANAPNCAPTRAAILSGQYGPRHGIYTVGTSERGEESARKLIPIPNRTELDYNIYTLAEALKTGGYVNTHIGKWHLGERSNTLPTAQGFDFNTGGNASGHPDSYFSPYQNPNLSDGPKGEHLTDRLTEEAISFIEDHASQSFFLNLWYYAVHTPIESKDSLVQHFTQKAAEGIEQSRYDPTYAAMIAVMDQGISRICRTLDSLGLTSNTLIIFASDNGPFYPVSTAKPLRGSKGMLYEGGIRIPMIWKWPDQIAAGSTSDLPVMTADIYPTLIEAATLPRPSQLLLDGVSLLPILTQATDTLTDRALFWHFPAYLQAYQGMDVPWRQTPAAAIRYKDWKLIHHFEDSSLELYNLSEDIGESTNLSEENSEKAQELFDRLRRWQNETNAPIPTQINTKYDPDSIPNT